MCVDFTDLNKACPKDSYPLPSIDALVDDASGCKMLSFLDAFSGYNQIKMLPRDESKTAFMTETLSSYVLVQEQDQGQKPIYFVSKALQGPETRYQSLEKAALAVVFSARRLRHYFHSFTVVVMTNLPIQKVLQKPDVVGRMVRWAMEFSEFDIQYEPRGSIKGQGSGAGIVLEGPNGVLIKQALRFAFKASNNQVEYEALIAGVLLAKEMGAQSLVVKSDSQLVTGQVTGEYHAKDPQMEAYLKYVQAQVCALEEGDTWMTPYRRYIAYGILPAEPGEGKRIKKNSVRYTLVDGVLFKHGFTHPILTCVSGDECTRIMSELHEGICGSHVGGKSLASKVIHAGFYWPSMREDCVRYAQRCTQCQMHAD
ncbi:uncharacterized protein [Phaseolus vulgaris]|uniref:uncharacterized protein n=1 Tax=Phaseolus vulgaris TaxID=3885 RepID=UPI0035CB92D3